MAFENLFSGKKAFGAAAAAALAASVPEAASAQEVESRATPIVQVDENTMRSVLQSPVPMVPEGLDAIGLGVVQEASTGPNTSINGSHSPSNRVAYSAMVEARDALQRGTLLQKLRGNRK